MCNNPFLRTTQSTSRLCTTTRKSQSKLKDLTTLYEITKQLASSIDLSDCLKKTMQILSAMKCDGKWYSDDCQPLTGKLEIEVAHGLVGGEQVAGKI